MGTASYTVFAVLTVIGSQKLAIAGGKTGTFTPSQTCNGNQHGSHRQETNIDCGEPQRQRLQLWQGGLGNHQQFQHPMGRGFWAIVANHRTIRHLNRAIDNPWPGQKRKYSSKFHPLPTKKYENSVICGS